MAQQLPPQPAQDAGEMWLRLFYGSTHAWAEASIGCAMTLAQIGAAQARAFRQLTGFGMSGWGGRSWIQSPDEMLREQFLFAEDQVERLADGVRTTLDDLKNLREQPARDVLP